MMIVYDLLYALFETIIYVMYLNIAFKNDQDMKIKNVLLIVLLTGIYYFFNSKSTILANCLVFIITSIYINYFYKGVFIQQIIKILLIHFNLFLVKEMCIFLVNHHHMTYAFYKENDGLGYLVSFMAFVVLLIEHLYLKKFLDKEFQLSKYMWHFVATVLVGVIFLDIFIFNEYIKAELNATLVSYVFFISFLVIILIYVVCVEMTYFYQNLMNEKIHKQALKYEETLVDVIGHKMQEYNKVVHDHKKLINELQSRENDEELNELINSMALDLPKEVIHTNHIAVNYTMNQFMEFSKENKIDFYGTYPQNMKIGMTSYDLLILLESLLENAFYISLKSNQRSIHYKIENEEYHIIIRIENNCTDSVPWDKESLKRLETIKKVCQKYEGRFIVKAEAKKIIQGCYLQYDEDLL